MKKQFIYSIGFFLAIFLTTNLSFAHRVEPKAKHKHVVVHRPVAPTIVFHRTTAVRSGYVWVKGHYTWDRRTRSYEWVPGKYVKQKRGKVWVDGSWKRVRGGWIHQPGSWKSINRF